VSDDLVILVDREGDAVRLIAGAGRGFCVGDGDVGEVFCVRGGEDVGRGRVGCFEADGVGGVGG